MIEIVLWLVMVFCAVYLALVLEAQRILSYLAAIIFLGLAVLWISSTVTGLIYSLLRYKNAYLSAGIIVLFLLLITYLAFRLASSPLWFNYTKYFYLGQQLLASVFLALLFTLSLSYLFRFMQNSGLVSSSYVESSVSYQMISQFSKTGDFVMETARYLFDTAEELTKSNFEPQN